MSFASKYYNVLGLKDNASLKEVKLAYRKLAKVNHPDISKDPNAHDKFIAICEAYEYLTQSFKTPARGRMKSEAYYEYKEKVYKEWVEKNEERVHQNAERKAAMDHKKWQEEEGLYSNILHLFFAKMGGCLVSFAIPIVILFFWYRALIYFNVEEDDTFRWMILGFFFAGPIGIFIFSWADDHKNFFKKKRKHKGQKK